MKVSPQYLSELGELLYEIHEIWNIRYSWDGKTPWRITMIYMPILEGESVSLIILFLLFCF